MLKQLNESLENQVGERTRELEDARHAAQNMLRDMDRQRAVAKQAQAAAEQARAEAEHARAEAELANELLEQRAKELAESQSAAMNMMRDADRARAAAELAQTEAEHAKETVEQHAKELEASRSATVNMMKDIDRTRQELAQRARELERSNKELDDFAYVASHDLKAPLRGIDNLAKWIAEDTANILPEKSRGHLQKMQQRVQRMEGLLDDMLRYSRAGRIKGTVEEIATGDLVRETIDMVSPPERFTVSVVSEMPTVLSDPAPLRQVFLNLIANAIKHHDRADGRVEVSATDDGEFVEFMVSDDGPGIPTEYHERIFRMFQTLRPRDEVEGSGMGLAVVKKVVESQGGRIGVESADGSGSVFRVTWKKMQ